MLAQRPEGQNEDDSTTMSSPTPAVPTKLSVGIQKLKKTFFTPTVVATVVLLWVVVVSKLVVDRIENAKSVSGAAFTFKWREHEQHSRKERMAALSTKTNLRSGATNSVAGATGDKDSQPLPSSATSESSPSSQPLASVLSLHPSSATRKSMTSGFKKTSFRKPKPGGTAAAGAPVPAAATASESSQLKAAIDESGSMTDAVEEGAAESQTTSFSSSFLALTVETKTTMSEKKSSTERPPSQGDVDMVGDEKDKEKDRKDAPQSTEKQAPESAQREASKTNADDESKEAGDDERNKPDTSGKPQAVDTTSVHNNFIRGEKLALLIFCVVILFVVLRELQMKVSEKLKSSGHAALLDVLRASCSAIFPFTILVFATLIILNSDSHAFSHFKSRSFLTSATSGERVAVASTTNEASLPDVTRTIIFFATAFHGFYFFMVFAVLLLATRQNCEWRLVEQTWVPHLFDEKMGKATPVKDYVSVKRVLEYHCTRREFFYPYSQELVLADRSDKGGVETGAGGGTNSNSTTSPSASQHLNLRPHPEVFPFHKYLRRHLMQNLLIDLIHIPPFLLLLYGILFTLLAELWQKVVAMIAGGATAVIAGSGNNSAKTYVSGRVLLLDITTLGQLLIVLMLFGVYRHLRKVNRWLLPTNLPPQGNKNRNKDFDEFYWNNQAQQPKYLTRPFKKIRKTAMCGLAKYFHGTIHPSKRESLFWFSRQGPLNILQPLQLAFWFQIVFFAICLTLALFFDNTAAGGAGGEGVDHEKDYAAAPWYTFPSASFHVLFQLFLVLVSLLILWPLILPLWTIATGTGELLDEEAIDAVALEEKGRLVMRSCHIMRLIEEVEVKKDSSFVCS